ncbi:inward rectifier potassium channel 4 [Daphnia magna]|uniref:Uncharacterized protein n=1 Tax=Daphnia magna TaxID=35525 RepID=A0ABR0AM67_9CRUS|nr:inward rectifier potassium channel 4 [Daphnia magna]KAK4026125.1 hypothetical protein OUZ56_015145 [Daphnia magna]
MESSTAVIESLEPMLPDSGKQGWNNSNPEQTTTSRSIVITPKQDQTSFKKRNSFRRLVTKSGESNISNGQITGPGTGTFVGLFTWLVDAKWRWTGFIFFASFYVTWTMFAVLFWLICYFHGDFETKESGLVGDVVANSSQPCVENIRDFTSIFLFSLEIQTTIGFGFSRVTEDCAAAIVTLTIQAILGTIIEAFLVGVVFTKLVRTKWRAQAIAFSQFSVICQQDGQLSLMFRIADRHTSRIIGARIRATLVSQTRTTREGHVVTLDQQPLRLHPSGEDSDLLLLWPTTIVHSITVESPLYGMNEADMMQAAFEIIVTLEGTTSSTDMSTQAMSSYLPCEILWGYRFDDMIGAKSDNGRPTVDHSLMDSIYPVGITAEDNGSVEFSPD